MNKPAPGSLWIQGGRIIDPVSQRDAPGDLFVHNGKIVEALSAEEKRSAEIIDAKGLVVSPGFVDIHVHLREPGGTHKESIATGTRAAAAGGFTTVVCMPNTLPACDNSGTIRRVMDSIEREALVNVLPTGCITKNREGRELAPIGSLARAGVVAITDDGDCVQSNELMRRAVEYAAMFGIPVMDHCQDASLTAGAVMNEGHWSLRLGLKGWPNAAEDIIVGRNVIIARYTGAQIHMQHISSQYSVQIIRRNKEQGIPVTAEACPHHLYFTDERCRDFDTNAKMNPPLRTEQDRQALIMGLLDGALDCIATDHAPHSDYEKDCEFDYAPFGIIGLETALAASLEVLYHRKLCDLATVVDLLTRRAARVLKLDSPAFGRKGSLAIGSDADITLFDPNESWLVRKDGFQSRSRNSPWIGETLRGCVHRTIVAGNTVWQRS